MLKDKHSEKKFAVMPMKRIWYGALRPTAGQSAAH